MKAKDGRSLRPRVTVRGRARGRGVRPVPSVAETHEMQAEGGGAVPCTRREAHTLLPPRPTLSPHAPPVPVRHPNFPEKRVTHCVLLGAWRGRPVPSPCRGPAPLLPTRTRCVGPHSCAVTRGRTLGPWPGRAAPWAAVHPRACAPAVHSRVPDHPATSGPDGRGRCVVRETSSL